LAKQAKRDIAYGGGKFVAVGDSGEMAYSADGVTWIAVADSTFVINGIAYSDGRFVAVGEDGKNSKIAYSNKQE
jgi:hypothetical protein